MKKIYLNKKETTKNSFKAEAYVLKEENSTFGPWYKGLILTLTKDGVTITLNEEEIVEMMKSFPTPLRGSFV
jgi:hypothetical protein